MLRHLIAATCAAFWMLPCQAQTWPERSVKMIVPFPAGGPLDGTARLLAERLAENLKQPFVIENRAGVAGNVGTEAVAKAAPDGYTLLVGLDTPVTVNPALYGKLTFNPDTDLAPMSIIASFTQMLVIHPSVDANSLAEFVALTKRNSLTYGSGGARGNPGHLTMEALRLLAGFQLVHVTYKGNPQVVADLVGGHIQAGFLASPSVIELVKDGKLRALAVSGKHRERAAPNVPTVAESGYADFDISFYQVMLAPAGLSETVRERIEREVQRVVKSADFQARLVAQGLTPIGSNGAEAADWLKAAARHWKAVIETSNIRPE